MTLDVDGSDDYHVVWESESFRKWTGIVTAESERILTARLTRLDGTLDVHFETPGGARLYRARADRQHGMWGTYTITEESTGRPLGYVEKHVPRVRERWEIRDSADVHVADITEGVVRGILTRQLNAPAKWALVDTDGNPLGAVSDDFRLWGYSCTLHFSSSQRRSELRQLLLLGTVVRYSRFLQ
ncbi:hypothetical protein G6M89_15890 [Natronolimnobius sp. AArcel1]|uniref:hypothetical protein n=1 Tax=Natronolimnobius sp. AArcel1 TaxID=1679093 RepID=UPI0013EA9FA3|nr:hypothetical protein [Natronolimnobius sp. AArcel1]NGM70464.1 hypothetical protein [Natronolimnobius sp. AArcel1]